MRRIIRRAAFGLTALVLVGCLIAWIVAGKLVAPAQSLSMQPPADLPCESISFDSESGEQIHGWHLSQDQAAAVIVLVHGIRSSRLALVPRARELWQRGYAVVMIDLQSHGESSGESIMLGQLEKHDVAAAVHYASQTHPDARIGVIGISLGGASAILASPLPIDALVVESVYSEIETAIENRVSTRLGPFAGLPSWILLCQLQWRLGINPDDLHPADVIDSVECPILVASGADDRYTTAAETERMFDRAAMPKELWLVPKLGHEDLFQGAREEYRKHVFGFLDRLLAHEAGEEKKSAHSRQREGIP